MESIPVVLNRGNRIGADWEITPEELARQFWASDKGKEWMAEPFMRLGRVVMSFVMEDLDSGWEREDWGRIEDAVIDTMPERQVALSRIKHGR